MKRTPIARKTRMPRGSKPIERAPGPKREKRLRQVGKRGRRDAAAIRRFGIETIALAKGRCRRCREPRADHELDPHHLVGRGRAPGWKDLHNAKVNGAALCKGPGRCHDLVTRHACADWRDWIWPAPLEAKSGRSAKGAQARG